MVQLLVDWNRHTFHIIREETRAQYDQNTKRTQVWWAKNQGERSCARRVSVNTVACIGKTTNSVAPGLEKTDNEMDLTSWPQVAMINQKNYYT